MPVPIDDAIRFCFSCGARLPGPVPVACTSCGMGHYANPKPCASALVIKDGCVLLVRRAIEPYYGYWDIPGGFCEVGEHPAASATRELQEELGLEVRITDYVGCWMDKYDDPTGLVSYSTLNIFYLAVPLGNVVSVGDDEVSEHRYFPILDLPAEMAFPDQANSALAVLQDAYMRKRLPDRGQP